MRIAKERTISGKLDTYIGEETFFEGTLTSKKSLTIYGGVKGKIECQGRIVVGQSGNIEADIVANDVAISGKVVGNVTAKSKLEMASTGVIQGDVKTARLIMEDGGKFDGHCEMLPDGKSAVVEKATTEQSPKALSSKEPPKELPDPSRKSRK